MSNESILKQVLKQVVADRFTYYGFDMYAISLEHGEYAVEVKQNRKAAPAMGSPGELLSVLSKYLFARGYEVTQADMESDGFKIMVVAIQERQPVA